MTGIGVHRSHRAVEGLVVGWEARGACLAALAGWEHWEVPLKIQGHHSAGARCRGMELHWARRSVEGRVVDPELVRRRLAEVQPSWEVARRSQDSVLAVVDLEALVAPAVVSARQLAAMFDATADRDECRRNLGGRGTQEYQSNAGDAPECIISHPRGPDHCSLP